MPSLSVTVPHALGRDEAVRRMKEESGAAKAAFGDRVRDLVESWNAGGLAFQFTVMGMTVEGTVSIGESDVTTTAKLPLAAMMFRGMIEERIRQRLASVLASS